MKPIKQVALEYLAAGFVGFHKQVVQTHLPEGDPFKKPIDGFYGMFEQVLPSFGNPQPVAATNPPQNSQTQGKSPAQEAKVSASTIPDKVERPPAIDQEYPRQKQASNKETRNLSICLIVDRDHSWVAPHLENVDQFLCYLVTENSIDLNQIGVFTTHIECLCGLTLHGQIDITEMHMPEFNAKEYMVLCIHRFDNEILTQIDDILGKITSKTKQVLYIFCDPKQAFDSKGSAPFLSHTLKSALKFPFQPAGPIIPTVSKPHRSKAENSTPLSSQNNSVQLEQNTSTVLSEPHIAKTTSQSAKHSSADLALGSSQEGKRIFVVSEVHHDAKQEQQIITACATEIGVSNLDNLTTSNGPNKIHKTAVKGLDCQKSAVPGQLDAKSFDNQDLTKKTQKHAYKPGDDGPHSKEAPKLAQSPAHLNSEKFFGRNFDHKSGAPLEHPGGGFDLPSLSCKQYGQVMETSQADPTGKSCKGPNMGSDGTKPIDIATQYRDNQPIKDCPYNPFVTPEIGSFSGGTKIIQTGTVNPHSQAANPFQQNPFLVPDSNHHRIRVVQSQMQVDSDDENDYNTAGNLPIRHAADLTGSRYSKRDAATLNHSNHVSKAAHQQSPPGDDTNNEHLFANSCALLRAPNQRQFSNINTNPFADEPGETDIAAPSQQK